MVSEIIDKNTGISLTILFAIISAVVWLLFMIFQIRTEMNSGFATISSDIRMNKYQLQLTMKSVDEAVEHLDEHSRLGGHPDMQRRVTKLEKKNGVED